MFETVLQYIHMYTEMQYISFKTSEFLDAGDCFQVF